TGLSFSLLQLSVFPAHSTHPAPLLQTISENQAKEKTISFLAVGDNLIHSQIYEEAELDEGGYDFKPFYAPFAQEIQQADLAFINQESIIGGDELGFSSYPA